MATHQACSGCTLPALWLLTPMVGYIALYPNPAAVWVFTGANAQPSLLAPSENAYGERVETFTVPWKRVAAPQ
jgi:hypothetical protein